MKEKKILYTNIVLLIALIASAIFLLRITSFLPKKSSEKKLPIAVTPTPLKAEEHVIYDIGKIKAAQASAPQEPADLKEVYERFPKEDVGTNMPEAWSRVKPEEKAKVNAEIDKKIAQSKEELKINPENKEARHMLFIAETMKKLTADGFNYKLEKVNKDENVKEAPSE